jgi:microcystin degradation protein MlrC
MLVAGEKSESEVEPLRSLIAACRSAERLPGIMAASYLLGFPWADDEHNGVSVLVTALEDPPARLREGRRAAAGQAAAGTGVADVGVATEAVAVKLAAEAVAVKLAADFWKRRRDFVFRSEYYDSRTSMDVAYKAVLEQSQRPVFVSDSGDNPTAGSTGDSTELFEAILATMDTVDKLPTPLLYSGFYDAAAAAACISAATAAAAANNLAGVDGGAAAAEVDLVVGGTWDKINGKRIPLRVRILAIRKDHGPYRSDLVLVGHGNLRLVLSSKHIGFGDGDLLPALGVKAEDYCLVVVKLGYLEPCFRSIAARAIMATSKGCSNEVLESIPYAKIRRPIYPLDPDMEFEVGKK